MPHITPSELSTDPKPRKVRVDLTNRCPPDRTTQLGLVSNYFPTVRHHADTHRLLKNSREHQRNEYPLNRILIDSSLALIELWVHGSVSGHTARVFWPMRWVLEILSVHLWWERMSVWGRLRVVVFAVVQIVVCENAEGVVGYWVFCYGDRHCGDVAETYR